MILDFFIQKHTCQHLRVPIDADEAYCPDCGELIQNKWFLVRCSCCNIKRHGRIEYNEIKPDTKFCPNCGSTDFFIEELKSINFVDVHYAVYKKIIIPQKYYTTRQIWLDKEEYLLTEKNLIELKT